MLPNGKGPESQDSGPFLLSVSAESKSRAVVDDERYPSNSIPSPESSLSIDTARGSYTNEHRK